MKTTLKQQITLVHTLKQRKKEQTEKMYQNDSVSPLKAHQVKALKEVEEEIKVLNDVEASLISMNLIGEKAIQALPQLIAAAEMVLDGEKKSDYMIHHNACLALKKILKSLK